MQLVVQNKTINLCDPITASVLIVNNSDRAVTVRNPDVVKGTLRLKVMHEQASIPQTQYSDNQELDTVVINKRDTLLLNFDIRKYFPAILDDGEYSIDAAFFPDSHLKHAILSEAEFFTLKEFAEVERKSVDDYSKFLMASVEGKYEYGIAFLNKYPNSCLCKIVNKEVAIALRLKGKCDEAILFLNNALSENYNTASWEKNEILNQLAWTFYKKGDVKAAIKMMEQMEDSHYKNSYLSLWKQEISEKK